MHRNQTLCIKGSIGDYHRLAEHYSLITQLLTQEINHLTQNTTTTKNDRSHIDIKTILSLPPRTIVCYVLGLETASITTVHLSGLRSVKSHPLPPLFLFLLLQVNCLDSDSDGSHDLIGSFTAKVSDFQKAAHGSPVRFLYVPLNECLNQTSVPQS